MSSQKQLPRWPAYVGLGLLAFGVLQPLLLEVLDVGRGGSLSVAEVISVLSTVLALLATTTGILTYNIVKSGLERHTKEEIAIGELSAQLPLYITMAAQAWISLEPLMLDPAPLGSDGHARRMRALYNAENLCRLSSITLDATKDKTDKEYAPKREYISFTWAFYLACGVITLGLGPNEPASRRACKLVDGLDPEDDGARESIAWVRLCCNEQWSDQWTIGRAEARELVPRAGDTLMKRRYQVAFGDKFFD